MTSRIAKVAATAAMSLMIVPGALAASGETVKITGKKHVKAGHKQKLVVSGTSPSKRKLGVFLDGVKCAKSYKLENARATAGTATLVGTAKVKGNFRTTVHIASSSAGTHYACAYLYTSKKTDRHASFKYVTK